MGLRDLFRSNKHDTPTPRPSAGPAPSAPAQDAPGDTAAVNGTPERAPQDGALRRPQEDAAPLPETGALRNLVELLLSRGADRARLTLVQSGNIMTHQTRQSVGQAQDEVENGTVDQGSPLFDDVADLYTQAMSTPVGPWRQLDLSVSPAEEGRREVTVTYDFPNGETRTEHYAQGGAPAGQGLRAAQGDAGPETGQHRGERLADGGQDDSQHHDGQRVDSQNTDPRGTDRVHPAGQADERHESTGELAAGTAVAGTTAGAAADAAPADDAATTTDAAPATGPAVLLLVPQGRAQP